MLIAGPRHLRAVLNEYVAHHNQHRPRRAMDLRPPDGGDTPSLTWRRRGYSVTRSSGLIHEYERAA